MATVRSSPSPVVAVLGFSACRRFACRSRLGFAALSSKRAVVQSARFSRSPVVGWGLRVALPAATSAECSRGPFRGWFSACLAAHSLDSYWKLGLQQHQRISVLHAGNACGLIAAMLGIAISVVGAPCVRRMWRRNFPRFPNSAQ